MRRRGLADGFGETTMVKTYTVNGAKSGCLSPLAGHVCFINKNIHSGDRHPNLPRTVRGKFKIIVAANLSASPLNESA